MPEGDTVYKAAATLRDALLGRVLTRTDFRVPAFATVDLTGETVTSVVPRGKHLLIRVSDGNNSGTGVTAHSHLTMEGVWHVYGHARLRSHYSISAISRASATCTRTS